MFRSMFAFLLTTGLGAADTVSDAFGILPANTLSEDRAAWAGLQSGPETLTVSAGNADAILLFIGPKSIVAGKDEGHAVALAFDRHGNLVQGSDVEFRLAKMMRRALVEDGLADVLFMPDPKAGTFSGGASIGSLQSARAIYRVVADIGSVQPSLGAPEVLVSENFSTLKSVDLADQFGNPVEDGIGTVLVLRHADGTTSLMSPTVREGRAEANFLVRDVFGGGELAMSLGINTRIQVVDHQSLEADGPIGVRLWADQDLNATAFRVGPIGTSAGYVLTDGAPVSVAITINGQTVETSGWVQDGYFESKLPLPPVFSASTVVVTTPLGTVSQSVGLSEAPKIIRGAE